MISHRLPTLLLLLLLFFCQSCVGTEVEVARVPSPDGTLEAVIVERDDGGLTSYRYDLRIVQRGEKAHDGISVGSLYGATRNDNAYGVNAKWEGSNTVAFEYLKTKRANLVRPHLELSGRQVTTIFRSGVLDPSARGNMAMYVRPK